MSFIPKPHEIYKHFKGNLYQIVAIAEHSETGEQLVIYQALYGDFRIYARPLDMFTSRVNRDKYPQVSQKFCFELQGKLAGERRQEELPEGKNNPTTVKSSSADRDPERSDEDKKEAEDSPDREDEGRTALDPLVLEFLDADTYEQRLNIMAGLHHRITDEMITTMAIACDIEINAGDVEERYEALKSCLLTLEKYECNRLR